MLESQRIQWAAEELEKARQYGYLGMNYTPSGNLSMSERDNISHQNTMARAYSGHSSSSNTDSYYTPYSPSYNTSSGHSSYSESTDSLYRSSGSDMSLDKMTTDTSSPEENKSGLFDLLYWMITAPFVIIVICFILWIITGQGALNK